MKVDDRGFVVHKWTKKIVDLKQVYLVVKDNRRIYQLALEFNQRPGERKPFTDVLQFNPTTSRDFTQTISRLRKELLGNRGGSAVASPARNERDERQRGSFDRRDDRHQPPAPHHTQANHTQPAQRQSAFGDAIANANARYQPNANVPVPPAKPQFTQAVSSAPVDPFAQPANPFGANVHVPPPVHSPTHAGPESVSGSVNFDNMMHSVQANGHQMQTLFDSPAPGSVQHQQMPVTDPFAQMSAPAPQMQQQMPVSDPFAMPAAPAPVQNPFAPAPSPAMAQDPFAAMPTQANPFAAPSAAPQQANPFAAVPYQPPTQQQNPSNPFA